MWTTKKHIKGINVKKKLGTAVIILMTSKIYNKANKQKQITENERQEYKKW